jgi:hypothetical protein
LEVTDLSSVRFDALADAIQVGGQVPFGDPPNAVPFRTFSWGVSPADVISGQLLAGDQVIDQIRREAEAVCDFADREKSSRHPHGTI